MRRLLEPPDEVEISCALQLAQQDPLDVVPLGFQVGDELCQRSAVSCIQHGRFSTEIGELYVQIASRSQQLAEPVQLVLQRVCPFRNEQRPGGAQDGAQLSRGHAHLVQAFRFPSEPGAWVMREQPSDMTCEGPLHMIPHRRIFRRQGFRTKSGQRKRAKELGASVMIFGSRSTELLFEVGQIGRAHV